MFQNQSSRGGLVYNGNEKVGDLLNRDTDGDSVSDWIESLYGTDPTKKDTNDDGVPDNVEIARITGQNSINGELNFNTQNLGSLTQTDLFSQELFSTVASLNQAGALDQGTIDKLSASLVENIQNSGNKKLFLYSDLKIIKPDSVAATKTYLYTLDKIYNKYLLDYTDLEVLQRFIIDENTVDESVLQEFGPIEKQTNNVINELSKMSVPESLALLHLDVLNKLQKYSENLNKITLYDTDPILAISGITQYQTSVTELETSTNNLVDAINQKLK